MHLPVTMVLLGENTDSTENSEYNSLCQMQVIAMVTLYWERKINENSRFCKSL